MHKDNILIFGGGPLQISIINNAKEVGLNTIVIDPDENAIGRKIADKFIRVDGNDFDGTVRIAKEYNVKGIVTAATDKPLLMMARVAEKLGLRFPSYESILNTINKYKFKEILLKNDLACARGAKYIADSLPNADSIDYPIILKPTNNSGSRGVVLCKEPELFDAAVSEALSESDGEVLIEEYIEGDEISVEALVFDNKVYILQITDKITTNPPYNVEVSQIQPSKYKNSHFEIIQQYLQKLIKVLKLNNCALHPEFKINDRGVFILEMGARLGGDYMTSHLVPLSTGINMEKALIKIATNSTVDILQTKDEAALIKYFIFQEGTLVKENINIDEFYLKYPELVLLETTLKKGDRINKITNSLNRYGHFIMHSHNRYDLENISQKMNTFLYNKIMNI